MKNVFNIILPPRVKQTGVTCIPKSLVEAVERMQHVKPCTCVRCIAESYRKPK